MSAAVGLVRTLIKVIVAVSIVTLLLYALIFGGLFGGLGFLFYSAIRHDSHSVLVIEQPLIPA